MNVCWGWGVAVVVGAAVDGGHWGLLHWEGGGEMISQVQKFIRVGGRGRGQKGGRGR